MTGYTQLSNKSIKSHLSCYTCYDAALNTLPLFDSKASIDPDEMPQNMASHQGQHSLLG